MNIDDIQKLIELVQAHKIAEVEVEVKGVKVKILGHHAPPPIRYMSAPAMAPAPAVDHAAHPAPPAAGAAPSVTHRGGLSAEDEGCPPGCIEIKSPMVGTFYRAPAPDAAPFVELGTRISDVTTVCIIEAMKLMNEIKAEVKGIIRRILIENGQPVEFNQPLFYVEKP